jgi:chromosome segregation ATPase
MRFQRHTAMLLIAALMVGPAAAQTARSGGGASAALMQQYQQLASERAQLQADNAKLKKDLETLKKQAEAAKQQLTASQAGVRRNEAALAAAQASNQSTAKSLDDTKGKMQELVARFRDTLTSLQGVEAERTQLRQQLAQSRSAFDVCAERNYSLYQVTGEVLDRYEHQGTFSYLARSEPFTRIKRTQIENLVDEYRQRAEELRVKKPDTSAGVPTASTATAHGK